MTEPVPDAGPDAGPDPVAEPVVEPGRHRAAPHRRRGALAVVAMVCAVLCLPTAAAAAYLLLRGPAPDTTAHARHDALRAATVAVHDLLSYDYRTLDADISRAKSRTTGVFAQQYAQTAGQLLGEAKQLKAIVQASVGLPGVVSAERDRVVVLVFVDQASVKQLPGQKTPATRIDQSRVQVTMTKVAGTWLVSALSAL